MKAAPHEIAVILCVFLLYACAPEPAPAPPGAGPDAGPAAMPPDPDLPVILAFGDSLTNGHDVDRNRSYPSQLQDKLDDLGYRYRVVNQGYDGETTSGGVARLPAALALDPEIVVVELGGNDGLRGTPIEIAAGNLSTIIEAFQNSGSTVVLAGLTLPRNYGPDYIRAFENMYVQLAEEHDVDLIPFFLEGLVDLEALDSGEALSESVRHMQSDGTHPTAEGYTIVADTVFGAIEPYLDR